MAFGIDDALLAGAVGIASGATTGAFNLFGSSQSNAATKELAKLQQYYAVQNAYLAHQFEQENLATTGCQNRQLQASAYKFDRALARYNRELQALSAQEDYDRSIKYIADAQSAYKRALQKNGYNPILALSSSIPSYVGHTNSAAGGSVGVGSAGTASTSAAPKAAAGGQGANPNLGQAVGTGLQGFTTALDFARTASDVKLNEANIKKAEADAVKSHADAMLATENAETAKQHRDPQKAKIESGTTKDYTSAVRDIAGPAVSAATTYVGGKWLWKKMQGMYTTVKNGGSVSSLLDKYIIPEMAHGNSAFLGSKVLNSVVPIALGGARYGLEKVARKLERNPAARRVSRKDIIHDNAVMGL